jgi:hypothetical protein
MRVVIAYHRPSFITERDAASAEPMRVRITRVGNNYTDVEIVRRRLNEAPYHLSTTFECFEQLLDPSSNCIT